MAKNVRQEATFKQVIQVALTPEMADEIVTLIADPKGVNDDWDRLPESGFQTTIKPNFRGNGFSAALSQMDATKPNAGLMVFANADTVLAAKCVMLIKLDFLGIDSDWLQKASQSLGNRFS